MDGNRSRKRIEESLEEVVGEPQLDEVVDGDPEEPREERQRGILEVLGEARNLRLCWGLRIEFLNFIFSTVK